jgi:hypothetical protein
MSALTDARARLAAGYYNSNPKTVANPGGLAANGHQLNFPAACQDLGLTLTQAGADALVLSNTIPAINAVPGLKAAAEAARDLALQYRDEAEQIVGVDLTLKANLASPSFTGTPTAPTPAQSDNTNRLATTAYVVAKFAALIGASPGTLDALNELAAALGNDPNFAASMATALGLKLDKAGGTISADLHLRTAGLGGLSMQTGGVNGAGFVGFYTKEGTRRGLVGWSNGTNLRIDGENGWGWEFGARPLFAGATPWDSGNLAPVDLASTQTVTGQKSFIAPNQPMISTGAVGTALMVTGTSTGPAIFAFHRPGIFATFFGIDTDNQLKVGGWSNGANTYALYHQGNDGAGSGLDADLFRGAAPDVAASANSIAKRGGDGSLQASLFYFSAWGSGFHMSDANWVRVYGDKGLATGGTVQAGVVRETSDARTKFDYQPLHDAGDLVDRTNVYRGKKRTADGLIDALYVLAQDQRLVTPEVVAEGAEIHDDGTPLLTVNYGQLALIAIAALQEERAAGRRRDRLISELQLRLEGAGL